MERKDFESNGHKGNAQGKPTAKAFVFETLAAMVIPNGASEPCKAKGLKVPMSAKHPPRSILLDGDRTGFD